MLKMISLIVLLLNLSGCAGKVTVPTQHLDMVNGKVNHRELTFDNKDCSLKSKLIFTEAIGRNQHGNICISPATFNKYFSQWQTEQCN